MSGAAQACTDCCPACEQELDPDKADEIVNLLPLRWPSTRCRTVNLLHHYAAQAKDFEDHGGDLETYQVKRKDDSDDSETTAGMNGLRITSN